MSCSRRYLVNVLHEGKVKQWSLPETAYLRIQEVIKTPRKRSLWARIVAWVKAIRGG